LGEEEEVREVCEHAAVTCRQQVSVFAGSRCQRQYLQAAGGSDLEAAGVSICRQQVSAAVFVCRQQVAVTCRQHVSALELSLHAFLVQ
jgi:hypothetical protein